MNVELVREAEPYNIQKTELSNSAFALRIHHVFDRQLFGQHILNDDWEITTRKNIEAFTSFYSTYPSRGPTIRSYGRDLIGDDPSPELLQKINDAKFSFVESFMKLAKSDQIELIKSPDGLCQTCVIGTHCVDNNTFNTHREDARAFASFVGTAEMLGKIPGIDYDIVPGTPNANFPEAIVTSKGVVLDIMSGYLTYEYKRIGVFE